MINYVVATKTLHTKRKKQMYTYKNQLNLKSCGATVAKDYYD